MLTFRQRWASVLHVRSGASAILQTVNRREAFVHVRLRQADGDGNKANRVHLGVKLVQGAVWRGCARQRRASRVSHVE